MARTTKKDNTDELTNELEESVTDEVLPSGSTTSESPVKPYTELYFEALGKAIPDTVVIENGYCQTCEQFIRTGLHGDPLCPAKLANCERHKS